MRVGEIQIWWGASGTLRVRCRDVAFFTVTLATDISQPRSSRFRFGDMSSSRSMPLRVLGVCPALFSLITVCHGVNLCHAPAGEGPTRNMLDAVELP